MTLSPRTWNAVATLLARDPEAGALEQLLDALTADRIIVSTPVVSEEPERFRRLWGAHDVRTHGAGTKRFRHPVVGELTLAYEEFAITAEPGHVMLVYTAEPGSPSAERLRLLASWGADRHEPRQTITEDT